MRIRKIFPLFLLPICLGCFSVPDFDNVPEIEFQSISNALRVDEVTGGYKDSITVSLKFRDGDGDLGYDTWERDSLEKLGIKTNFLVTIWRKDKGKYVVYEPTQPIVDMFFRLSKDKPGPIEGVIHYRYENLHSFYRYPKDTVKFEIAIMDRAGHISNKVMTDSVIFRPI
ncbi:hypothetical protein Lbys_2764 [Leadbetterella byssophila DSM 17132]|jgi:hypothetical protein|uniref:Lipoprotein n=1 Tax=Leadbetterella byssophila (strain DSM 17132 / JCM 16389 / KACC 11308 / NBRC 106382 / 4M15) TaxID=649349 RepID=E4RQY3_LEAB4|nr:hypothetical protein [Leadbetterella byssophila]ADQ18426.1 hypothetical protein Lbys_2764 [Leadbetterella byssophila DSM 17132]